MYLGVSKRAVQAAEMVGGVFEPGENGAGLHQAFPFQLKWPSFLGAAGEEGLSDRLQRYTSTCAVGL